MRKEEILYNLHALLKYTSCEISPFFERFYTACSRDDKPLDNLLFLLYIQNIILMYIGGYNLQKMFPHQFRKVVMNLNPTLFCCKNEFAAAVSIAVKLEYFFFICV